MVSFENRTYYDSFAHMVCGRNKTRTIRQFHQRIEVKSATINDRNYVPLNPLLRPIVPFAPYSVMKNVESAKEYLSRFCSVLEALNVPISLSVQHVTWISATELLDPIILR